MKSLHIICLAFSLMMTPMAVSRAEPASATSPRGTDSNRETIEGEATTSRVDGVTTATLALTGDPAPDGNGDFDVFWIPSVNERGAVAVPIQLGGTQLPNVDDEGIYLFDSEGATKLARSDEPIPAGDAVFRGFPPQTGFPTVALNDQDQVAFYADLTLTLGNRPEAGVDPTFGAGLFGAHATDGITEYVRLTDPAPDGNGVFGAPEFLFGPPLSLPGLDEQNRIAFHGYLIDTTGGMDVDDFGIFRSDGSSVTQLLRLGQAAPIGGQTVETINSEFGSNAIGQAGMEARVDVPFPGNDADRIYIDTDGGVQQVFVSGGSPPDGDGIIINMARTRIAENGNIAFEAFVNDTANVLDEGNTIFFYDRVILYQIARIDQLAPFETTPFEFDTFPGFDLNNQNEVVLSAGLQFDSMPVATVTSVIYRWNAADELTVAVHEGDPAPDTNGTFGNLEVPVFLNDSGQIVFGAEIEGTTPPFGLPFDMGLFVIDPDGTIRTVARTGQMLAGSTVISPLSFASTEFIYNPPEFSDFSLRLGGNDPINNRGQVAFSAILSDDGILSERGLFLWNGPLINANGMEGGTLAGWDSSFP